jgi:hypothetical protein
MPPITTPPAHVQTASLKLTHRAAIGACAGISLILVKLTEANFYLGRPRDEIVGGLLTVLAFVVLSTIFSTFVDEDNPRKLFVQGLLAPSLLIALVHQGADVRTVSGDNPGDIPFIGALIAPVVLHAAEPALAQAPRVKRIDPAALNGTALDGALLLLGRGQPRKTFLFVVGRATDAAQARSTATQLREALSAAWRGGAAPEVEIMQFAGQLDVYVTVGGLRTSDQANAVRREAIAMLLDSRVSNGREQLRVLANGKVVDGRQLSATK